MHPYWDSFLKPVLERLRPTVIVEIGVEAGKTTGRLLDLCAESGGTVHAIDPAPRFDVEAWTKRYAPSLVVHRASSLEVLPRLDRFDVVLIDGDHNWYTVFNELTAIDTRCTQLAQPFPVVFLHDVGWPYGRRDLYYDPDAIPAEFRQPHAKRGLLPGHPEPVLTGGVNATLNNALSENTPFNGVLTAVEDFLSKTTARLTFCTIPGFHGLGILRPTGLGDADRQLAAQLQALEVPDHLKRYIARLEHARLELKTQLSVRRRSAPGGALVGHLLRE